jgi:hypothetical protein
MAGDFEEGAVGAQRVKQIRKALERPKKERSIEKGKY